MTLNRYFLIIIGVFFISQNLSAKTLVDRMKRQQKMGVENLYLQNTSQTVMIKGQKTRVIQSYDSKGRPNKTISITKKEAQIKLDRNGDGRADYWEVQRPGLRVIAQAPQKNIFQSIEVQKQNISKKGWDKTFLVYNKKKKGYQVVDRRFAPGKVYLREDLRLNDSMCDSDPAHLLSKQWKDMEKNIVNKPIEDFLKELDSNQTSLFASNCRTGEFADSFPLIKEALAEVILSPEQKDEKGTQRSSYLKCMSLYGLDYHRARIEAELFQNFEGKKSRNASSLIQCKKMDAYGSYSSWWEEVTLGKTADQLGSGVKSSNMTETAGTTRYAGQLVANDKTPRENAVKNYAKTLFHELLHSSQIENESLVHQIEECCGDPQSPGSTNCQALQKTVQDDYYKKNIMPTINQLSVDKAGTMYTEITYGIPNSDEVNKFKDDLETTISRSIAEGNNRHQGCMDNTAITPDAREACLNQYKTDVVLELNSSIEDKCMKAEFSATADKTKACEKIKRSALEMAENMIESRGIFGQCLDPNRSERLTVDQILSGTSPQMSPIPGSSPLQKKKLEFDNQNNFSLPPKTGADLLWKMLVGVVYAAQATDEVDCADVRNNLNIESGRKFGIDSNSGPDGQNNDNASTNASANQGEDENHGDITPQNEAPRAHETTQGPPKYQPPETSAPYNNPSQMPTGRTPSSVGGVVAPSQVAQGGLGSASDKSQRPDLYPGAKSDGDQLARIADSVDPLPEARAATTSGGASSSPSEPSFSSGYDGGTVYSGGGASKSPSVSSGRSQPQAYSAGGFKQNAESYSVASVENKPKSNGQVAATPPPARGVTSNAAPQSAGERAKPGSHSNSSAPVASNQSHTKRDDIVEEKRNVAAVGSGPSVSEKSAISVTNADVERIPFMNYKEFKDRAKNKGYCDSLKAKGIQILIPDRNESCGAEGSSVKVRYDFDVGSNRFNRRKD